MTSLEAPRPGGVEGRTASGSPDGRKPGVAWQPPELRRGREAAEGGTCDQVLSSAPSKKPLVKGAVPILLRVATTWYLWAYIWGTSSAMLNTITSQDLLRCTEQISCQLICPLDQHGSILVRMQSPSGMGRHLSLWVDALVLPRRPGLRIL